MAEFIEREAFLADKKWLYCTDCDKRKGKKRGKMVTLYEIGEAPCKSCGIHDMLEEVECYPAADVRPVEWIPVTERLPEVRTWVLCYCRANSFDVFRMTDEGNWQYGNRSTYMKGYVTHWMPLPEPPKEEC